MINLYTVIIPVSAVFVFWALHKYAVSRAKYLVKNNDNNLSIALTEEEPVIKVAPVAMPFPQPEAYTERRAAA